MTQKLTIEEEIKLLQRKLNKIWYSDLGKNLPSPFAVDELLQMITERKKQLGHDYAILTKPAQTRKRR